MVFHSKPLVCILVSHLSVINETLHETVDLYLNGRTAQAFDIQVFQWELLVKVSI